MRLAPFVLPLAFALAGCTEAAKPAVAAPVSTAARPAAPAPTARSAGPAGTAFGSDAPATAEMEPVQEGGLQVAGELAGLCHLHTTGGKQHFGTNDDALLPAERDLLVQLAACLSAGPLRTRRLELVGRADSRGEQEYNMVLGEKRAARVATYLESAGVGAKRMHLSSRGELDSQGRDEGGWQEDRRVDITLTAEASKH